ncbi:spidroin-1-like [Iris pallida]|uniref:Spidroin-1-like n=1 Tax=Iris pallida TaxID=29817 RepID=A0AAX6DT96_IRIPA|nr:spidroin-1-like [Iris pallida]
MPSPEKPPGLNGLASSCRTRRLIQAVNTDRSKCRATATTSLKPSRASSARGQAASKPDLLLTTASGHPTTTKTIFPFRPSSPRP